MLTILWLISLVQIHRQWHQSETTKQKRSPISSKIAWKLQKKLCTTISACPILAGFPSWEIRRGRRKIPTNPSLKLAKRFSLFWNSTCYRTQVLFVLKWYAITSVSILNFSQVIIVDPNRSGYFNFRALAVVSRERFTGSGAQRAKEVEVHCTEPNVLKDDTFWLPIRSLEMEIWSPVREANMRIQNKVYYEHVKSMKGKRSI